MCLGDIGNVVAVAGGTATVRVAGRERTVSLLMRPDTQVGEHVVVHTGFVVDAVTPHEAAEATTLRRSPGPGDHDG